MNRRACTALLLVAAACKPAGSGAMSDQDRATVAAGVRQADAAFWAALPSRNVDSVMAHFASNVVFADEGMIFPTRDSLTVAARATMGTERSAQVTVGDRRITVLGPDAAVLTTTFEEMVVDTAGGSATFKGAWSAVWQREHGRWLMVQSHESLPSPEAAPATPPARRRS